MKPYNNVLFGVLPKTVCVFGDDVPINTDFRIWLKIGEILRSEMCPERKAANVLSLCYPKKVAPVGAAFGAAIAFYNQGFPQYGSGGKAAVYSPDFDGRVIYSGFRKCYGIDLSKETLHWHAFAPLLCELSDCTFAQILAIRSDESANPELKRRFRLPGTMSDSEFANSIWEVMK